MMMIYKLFSNGKLQFDPNSEFDLSNLPIENNFNTFKKRLGESREKIHDISIEAFLGFSELLSKYWSNPERKLYTKIAHLGLNFLIFWLKKANLQQILNESLRGNYKYLDDFYPSPNGQKLLRCQPRGIAIHWIAGNIPVLGFISLWQSLLTKNVNLVKTSSSYTEIIPLLLYPLSNMEYTDYNGNAINGKEILKGIEVIYFPGSDKEANKQFSRMGDIRIAWGGKEAIKSILSLPKKINSEDIIFGPRQSFIVIGKNMMNSHEKVEEIARKASYDICYFDQYACSSPHTIFVEKGGKISPSKFAKILAEQLEKVSPRIPKGEIGSQVSMRILNIRAEYDFTGEAYYPKTTEWTVLYSDDDSGLADACYSRTIFVRPIDNIMDIPKYCSYNTQSLGIIAEDQRKLKLLDKASFYGVDRGPKLKQMNVFETPWDGMYPIDRMVRWVSTYRGEKFT